MGSNRNLTQLKIFEGEIEQKMKVNKTSVPNAVVKYQNDGVL